MKRALMVVLAASGLGLLGSCGIPFEGHGVPPAATSGSSGTSGTSGSCAPCSQLAEQGCLARKDCAPVYEDTCSGRQFQRCEDKVCPAVTCPAVMSDVPCRAAMGSDGCPTCECGPTNCQSDADCAPGEVCDLAGACPRGASCGPSEGQCAPRSTSCSSDADCGSNQRCDTSSGQCESICPMVACAQSSTGAPCRATTGPDGCPTCECAPTTCNSDADCASDQTCQPDPTDPCNGTNVFCDAPGRKVCQSPAPCRSDADCSSGETCQRNPAAPGVWTMVCLPSTDACVSACTAQGPGCMNPTDVCWSDGQQYCSDCFANCHGATRVDCDGGWGSTDGGVWSGDGGWGSTDGGVWSGDGGWGSDGGSLYCASDADCPTGEHCGGCGPDSGCIYSTCDCAATCQPNNCGTVNCTSSEVCVHGYGGAAMLLPDGGVSASEGWSCAPYPSSCRAPGVRTSCDCIGQAICGGMTDCSSPMITVTCFYP